MSKQLNKSLDLKKTFHQSVSPQRLKALSSVKVDSPRFILACRELGILPESLKLKPYSDFVDSYASEEICKLRYNHYLNRLQQTIRDIYTKRKEIRERSGGVPLGMMASAGNQQNASKSNPASSFKGSPGASFKINPATQLQDKKLGSFSSSGQIVQGPQGQLTFQSPKNVATAKPNLFHRKRTAAQLQEKRAAAATPTEYVNRYRLTVSYLEKSHNSPEITSPLLDDDDKAQVTDPGNISHALSDQVFRYNRAKMKIQSEAQNLFEAERWRFNLLEEMKKKAGKIEGIVQNKLSRELETQKAARERAAHRAKRLEKKLELIERQKEDRAEKLEARERMHTELVARDQEERRMQRSVSEMRHRQKMMELAERRQSLEEEINFKLDSQLVDLQEKFEETSAKHSEALTEKAKRMRAFSEKASKKLVEYKEESEKKYKEYLGSLQEKIVKRDETLKTWMEQMAESEAKRKEEIQQRERRFIRAKAELNNQEDAKKQVLEARQQKAERHLLEKREKEERDIALKQEYRLLKEADKIENYERERRREDYRTKKTKEREMKSQERLSLMKVSLELLNATRKEVAQHTRLEKQRVLSGITALTSELFTAHVLQGEEIRLINAMEAEKLTKALKLLDSLVAEDQMSESMKDVRSTIVQALKKYKLALEEAQKQKMNAVSSVDISPKA